MQIIKDKQLVENTWAFVGDENEVPESGDITVSLATWKAKKSQLLNRSGKTGIRLTSTDDTAELVDELNGVELIELNFPGFGDGRPFSQARLLRSRLKYAGELRAIGNFLADQVFFMTRVGFNSFLFPDQKQVTLALSCMADFTVCYQESTV